MKLAPFLFKVILLSLAGASALSAATSDLWGKAGEHWTPSSPLPDFSFAGYRMGTAEPVVPEARVSVKDFGATGDGTTDDTGAILKAITAAPGKVIFFPAGRYVVTKFLQITQSGTVLQGAGTALTTLLMPVPMNTIVPRVFNNPASSIATTLYSWSGGMISLAGNGYAGEALSIVAAAAKRGDTTLQVADTSKLEVGSRVVLELNDNSARTLLAHVYRGDSGDLSKLKETYALQQVLTVVKIEGQTLKVDRPLRSDVNTEWTPVLKRYAPTLENCGVEHLTIEFPATPYRGHWTEEGYNPVEIKGAADCWLRGLKIVNPDSGPFVIGSVFCTLDGIEFTSTRKPAVEDIQGHHGISLMGVDCLCRNFTIGMKFFHDLTVSQGSTGNVFSNGRATDLAIDNHRHGPYENLFTQLDAGLGTRLWTSGGSTGQGKHAAAGAVFWNIKTKKDIAMPSADFAPDGGLVLAGLKLRVRKSEVGKHQVETISPGKLEPPDLHEAQRTKRLGLASQGTGIAVKAFTWTNTAGRSIQAQFVGVEGANVLLRMDGKDIPVPLSSLSAASLQQAQSLEQERTRQ
ncbi:MAG: glycoside hydrolase family 55 protein [Prosthecobacter sp.]|uniref:glycosyl hydrolase family 28-related protein n=1 Tax=Prosthecobacter sp. TaxID=1965333 RepID=UPI002617E073|nr:glycosyl hydrolase family 28-related protein [Prosthecobacter sp.]MCF7790293.1 glycoside hydrolase family 55 protein [Prosthecobacter sp.]